MYHIFHQIRLFDSKNVFTSKFSVFFGNTVRTKYGIIPQRLRDVIWDCFASWKKICYFACACVVFISYHVNMWSWFSLWKRFRSENFLKILSYIFIDAVIPQIVLSIRVKPSVSCHTTLRYSSSRFENH